MDFDGIPHKPVMLAEVLEFIHPQEGEWVFIGLYRGLWRA